MLSSSVFAQTQNKSFYLGAEAGAVMFKNIEIDNLEHKSQTSPTLGIKGGYYFNDMFRSEIAISMPLDINYKFNGTFYGLDDGGQFYGLPVNYKIKGKGLAVFINGYIDLLNINNTAKIFIGGGIGASKINGKYKINLTLLDGSKKELVFSKSKNALSFAYQISVGASYIN